MQRRITRTAAQMLVLCAALPVICWGQTADRQAAAPRQAGVAAKAAEAEHARKLDRLLKLWEQKSTELQSLDVKIFRIDQNPAWDVLEYYDGRALFKSPNLAFIDFSKIQQDDKKKPLRDPKNVKNWLSTPSERIVCTGQEVWQYKSDTQQIFIFPLGKDQKQKAIEEGPLPFLFNMRAVDARKRYDMHLISEDEKGYGISITPKVDEDKESFSIAYVNLDRNYLLPVRILMRSPDGKSQKDFRLGPIFPNKKVNEKNFEGKPIGSPWKIVRNPGGADRPGGAKNRVRDAQGEPAAARPGPGSIDR